uniref:CSON008832 protein n=1 Tax=Culicoides sonorensis TaxID=179676 RepID=A0A336M351_CULSO
MFLVQANKYNKSISESKSDDIILRRKKKIIREETTTETKYVFTHFQPVMVLSPTGKCRESCSSAMKYYHWIYTKTSLGCAQVVILTLAILILPVPDYYFILLTYITIVVQKISSEIIFLSFLGNVYPAVIFRK